MIPLELLISGFLSYRDPASLDFTRFSLACISGPNGAGKSTLLDAMTWALFGQARRRDEALINLQSKAAEVALTFQYEDVQYRVQRTLARGRSTILELQARRPPTELSVNAEREETPSASDGSWTVLTERTVRDTQARLQQILRLDYETFVNASFFLQGKADQFAQQSPTKRKEILTNILGLGEWEGYKARVAELRRRLEEELAVVEGRLAEILGELAQEGPRREHLIALEADLARVSAARAAQAAAVEDLRKAQASLDKQRIVIEGLQAGINQSQDKLADLERRLSEGQASRSEQASLLLREEEIQESYVRWQAALHDLHRWDRAALAFNDRSKIRAFLVGEINAEKARLEEEHRQLVNRHEFISERMAAAEGLGAELEVERAALAQAETGAARKAKLLEELATARESVARLQAENQALRGQMDQLATRIGALESASGAACPLCGQPLSDIHRASTLNSLKQEGQQSGDTYRANKAAVGEQLSLIAGLQENLEELTGIDEEQLTRAQSVARLVAGISSVHSDVADWETSGRSRLASLAAQLQNQAYASEQHEQLAALDAELAELGYDATAHDDARHSEAALRLAEDENRRLELARAAAAPLDRELEGLESDVAERSAELARQISDLEKLKADFADASTGLPDPAQAESRLFDVQQQENVINQQVGAARQRVNVLDELRVRRGELEASRQILAVDIGRHKMLERGFGKDGVPALLIEQALPEVETRANEILDRLSDGQMSIRFRSQTGYKDKKRVDLRETLDIQISDGAGPRDYEMYSGGEAFRVNFAIRLALSQVLAARKGARLQTLVIDEGFGSQDLQGRQRLIEAINLVKNDFEKVLLITHLDELKDAFPTRIEVEKSERGSVVRVI
jgi:exonuclease SbcC